MFQQMLTYEHDKLLIDFGNLVIKHSITMLHLWFIIVLRSEKQILLRILSLPLLFPLALTKDGLEVGVGVVQLQMNQSRFDSLKVKCLRWI